MSEKLLIWCNIDYYLVYAYIFFICTDITPWIKQIDTVSAEWPAATNYLYLTYCSASSHDVVPTPGAIMVLG